MIRNIFLLVFLLIANVAHSACDSTTNGYFCLPQQGTSGAAERLKFFNSLQFADGIIGLMRSANYWTNGVNSTLAGETDLESADLDITGSWNFSAGKLMNPKGTTLPTTDCDAANEAGRIFIDTDATTGQQLYVCEGLAGWVLSSGSGTGGSSAGWSIDGTNVYTADTVANVGIGTSIPEYTLDVSGDINADAINVNGTRVCVQGDSTCLPPAGGWTDTGTNIFTTTLTRNVGIGTATPEAKLHVAGGAIFDGSFSGMILQNGFKINGGTTRKFIIEQTGGTHDSNLRVDMDSVEGVASVDSSSATPIDTLQLVDIDFETNGTVTASSFIGDGSALTGIGASASGWTDSGTNIYNTATSDRVAIGTTSPITGSKLHVVGTVSATAFVGDGSGLTGIVGGGGLGNVVEDTTPQLGGDLDMNGHNIDFPSTANISDVLDEDNMASNSATKLATQQSIKAYVDTAISGVSGGSGGWTDGGTNVYLTLTTDTVAIGTTTPTAQLLVSNVGTGDSFRVDDALNDTTPFLITSAGSVGIGTSSPSSPFQFGAVSASNFISMSTASAPAMAIRADSASTVDLLNIQSSSVSSGNVLDVSSSSASQTVPLALFTQSAASSGGTLRVNQSSGSSTGKAAHITNAGTGETFLVEDVATDSSPFLIGSDGNVGIGTTTVSANKLRVVGNIDATSFSGDGSALTGISGGASGWTDGTAVIYTTTSTDNVGIGTFNPLQRLQVVGTIQATAFTTSSTSAGSLVLNEASANGSNTITISAPSSISSNRSCALEDDSTPFDNCVSATSSGWTDAGATINVTTSTDNVGIGTSSPEKRLVLSGADSDMVIRSSTNSAFTEMAMQNDAGEALIVGASGTAASGGLQGYVNMVQDGPLHLLTNDTARVTITGSGNVGIGSTTPTGALDIRSTASSIGWTVVDQTDNQACNTGCSAGCVFGFENATGTAVTNIVSCAATTADLCLCAGSN